MSKHIVIVSDRIYGIAYGMSQIVEFSFAGYEVVVHLEEGDISDGSLVHVK